MEVFKMMISTKGRYALRVVIDLAQNCKGNYISLKEIAARQGVSLKYLELIVANLNKAGIVLSMRGPAGGYKLASAPKDITAAQVITATEGSLTPVSCIENMGGCCDRADNCLTLPMWRKLEEIVQDYLGSVTIENLINGEIH